MRVSRGWLRKSYRDKEAISASDTPVQSGPVPVEPEEEEGLLEASGLLEKDVQPVNASVPDMIPPDVRVCIAILIPNIVVGGCVGRDYAS
jgi:hypothetical protein